MGKYLVLILVAAATSTSLNAQSINSPFLANPVNISTLDSLDEKVYNLLADYRLIMVGEMHGTNEPSRFVAGLTKLFTAHNDSVQVGFEISDDKMSAFLKMQTDSSIYLSDFFSNGSQDGRASMAWARALTELNSNPRVKLFFYDVTSEDDTCMRRDSLMYLKIRKGLLKNPGWKTITLSGNIHNRLLLYKGKATTAYYLKHDIELNLQDELCSLNHLYEGGTMLNNVGDGLKLHQVTGAAGDFPDLADFLYLFQSNEDDNYTGYFFTRTVTAAIQIDK